MFTMPWFIFLIFGCFSVCSCRRFDDAARETRPSVLIIGSSIPALTSALLLTDHNYSVTILYATKEIDNQISATTTFVKDVPYRLPKHHPSIFEHSIMARSLAQRFGNTFSTETNINLLVNEKENFPISLDESIMKLLIDAVYYKCITAFDVFKSSTIRSALEKYDYATYRKLYSNITLAQFAKLMKAPPSFVTCFLSSSLIDLGLTVEDINAADAVARMQFYYLNGKNGLQSYHMDNPYSSMNDTKLLVDQIYRQLKLKNTTFVPNYAIEALWVDPESGKILGDLNNRKTIYDYIIIGDNLNRSRVLLTTTQSYNSGAPKIYKPLKKALDSLNQYSYPPKILSIKCWFSHDINDDRKSIIQVNNSPFPYSIQSIKRINKLAGKGNPGYILEIIVADKNHSSEVNWKKIAAELGIILPELSEDSAYICRLDPIDTGVAMDVKYGSNRLSMSSLQEYGIPNLILAADWIDAENSTACDLEKSVVIGYQAASKIIAKG